jgi:hypothetical protein
MNYDNLKKIGYFNVANDIMMKRMALELDTDKMEDNKFSDILATLEKLKTQVDQIPEYEFKKDGNRRSHIRNQTNNRGNDIIKKNRRLFSGFLLLEFSYNNYHKKIKY